MVTRLASAGAGRDVDGREVRGVGAEHAALVAQALLAPVARHVVGVAVGRRAA